MSFKTQLLLINEKKNSVKTRSKPVGQWLIHRRKKATIMGVVLAWSAVPSARRQTPGTSSHFNDDTGDTGLDSFSF
jgi:hypothetical protein